MQTKELYKVTVAIKKEDKEDFLTKLQEKELIHLEKVPEFQSLDVKNLDILEKAYLDFASVIQWIKKDKENELIKEYKTIKPLRDKELFEKAYEKIKYILKLIREYEEIENIKIPNLKKKIFFSNVLDRLGVEKPSSLKVESFNVYLFSLNEKQYKIFKEKIKDAKNIVDRKIVKDKENYYILLISKEKINCSFNSILEEVFRVLNKEEQNENTFALLKKFENELKNLEEKKKELKKEILDTFERYRSLILQVYKYLKEEVEKIKEKDKIKESEHFVIISGYVPKDKFKEFLSILKDYQHLLEKKEVKISDEAPSLIENKKLNGFQSLVEQYGVVKYGWLDPTLLFAISFSIFYGFIIGDIGYGFLILLIGLYLKSKEKFKEIGNLVIILGLSSIIFGFLFGSLFGVSIIKNAFNPIAKENLLLIVEISVILGLIYMTIGSLLAIYYGIKTKDYHYVLDNFAFLSFIYGLILLIFLKSYYIGAGLIILGILAVLKSQGILGLLDLSSFVGSILSFARVGALAISGAFISYLINKLFIFLLKTNLYLGILAIPLILLLHLGNFIMSVLGATIHSLRLNYLEFFNRVFKEGKEKFKAFGRFSKNL
jgi:V/A-type H+-transporting ATPase subunit I